MMARYEDMRVKLRPLESAPKQGDGLTRTLFNSTASDLNETPFTEPSRKGGDIVSHLRGAMCNPNRKQKTRRKEMLPIPTAANQTAFVFLILITMIMLATLYLSLKGIKKPTIRKIAGLDAIGEAVGRATEMGRPVHFTPGIAGLGTDTGPQTLAGLSVLAHVAELAAKYKTTLWVTIRIPQVQPLAAEIVRQAYVKAGAPDAYDEDKIIYLSDTQFAYASGVVGLMHREKVAANIMIGGFWAESLLFAEGGYLTGAIQVAGTANTAQIPFFVAACDYCLIGEEVMAAGAYLSNDPAQIGAIWGQDCAKAIAIFFMGIGVLLSLAGNDFLWKLLSGPLWK